MRSPLPLLLPALLIAVALAIAPAASADTVRFAKGEASYVVDGNVGCLIGVSKSGAGTITCVGPDVYDAFWKGTSCDARDEKGCSVDDRGYRAVELDERGKPKRGWIGGVGGVKDPQPGDSIIAGDIRGKRLKGGGFTFTNDSRHGFTLTDERLRRF